jgi:hypothetical protein
VANDDYPLEDYKVGPGKPPKHTRFQPGQSGNPKGRPKGSQNVKTLFNKVGRESVRVKHNGRSRKLTKQQVIVHRFTNHAMTGPERAARDYLVVSKAFEEPEEGELTSSAIPENHKMVVAEIVRRIRQGDVAQTAAEDKPVEIEELETSDK